MTTNFAHAAQYKLNCGAFGNDLENRSFVIAASGTDAKLTFNATNENITGTINASRSNITVTV